MTRSADSSAPAHDLIDSLLAQPSPDPILSWRRALPGAPDVLDHVKAKSIRLGETATPTQSRESNRNSNLVSIDGDNAVSKKSSQCGTIVQRRELTDMDRKVIAALVGLGGFATAKEIHAAVTGASLFVVRSRLDKLASDGAVLNVPGRGYELRERR
jgi:hypothetical protein